MPRRPPYLTFPMAHTRPRPRILRCISRSRLTVRRVCNACVYTQVRCEPHERGSYLMHITLHGTPISDSPVAFDLTPAQPNGNKCRLITPAGANIAIGLHIPLPRHRTCVPSPTHALVPLIRAHAYAHIQMLSRTDPCCFSH